jgi:CheY-like chemotaxis protein
MSKGEQAGIPIAALSHEWLQALASLLWPLIVLIVIWRLFPLIRSIAESRSFTVKIAGMEVSVQDATEKLREQIDDLQKKVIEIRSGYPMAGASSAVVEAAIAGATAREGEAPPARPRAILWVDDKPSNNAIEVASLRQRGIEVKQSQTTEEALAVLSGGGVSAVLSDMGRFEAGKFISRAGLALLKNMRRAGHNLPFLVYTSPSTARNQDAQVRETGGDGATASPVDLMEWIERVLA